MLYDDFFSAQRHRGHRGNTEIMKEYLRLVRGEQWAKNLFIFLPLFFNAEVTKTLQLGLCLLCFAGFSLVASSVYCLNDVIDVAEDRKHPEKSKRPVASGRISKRAAVTLAILLFCGGMAVVLISRLPANVVFVILIYYFLNLAYIYALKHIAILDILCIAFGFVLRVVSGGFATGITLSHWIVLMTFLLASFLACAKRRDDVLHYMNEQVVTRKNVTRYNTAFLNVMMSLTATITILCYIMYTVDKEVIERFNGNPYIYVTSIFVIAGILRYLQIAMVEGSSGNPTRIFLKDRFIQCCILGWILAFVFIIYV